MAHDCCSAALLKLELPGRELAIVWIMDAVEYMMAKLPASVFRMRACVYERNWKGVAKRASCWAVAPNGSRCWSMGRNDSHAMWQGRQRRPHLYLTAAQYSWHVYRRAFWLLSSIPRHRVFVRDMQKML